MWWYKLVKYGKGCYDMVWYGLRCYEMLWNKMVWDGKRWFEDDWVMVWVGMIRDGMRWYVVLEEYYMAFWLYMLFSLKSLTVCISKCVLWCVCC